MRQIFHEQGERVCFKGLEVIERRCTGERCVILTQVGVSPDQHPGKCSGRGAGLEGFEKDVGPPGSIARPLTDTRLREGGDLVSLLSQRDYGLQRLPGLVSCFGRLEISVVVVTDDINDVVPGIAFEILLAVFEAIGRVAREMIL